MIDAESGGNLLLMPLDRLLQQGGDTSSSGESRQQTQPATIPTPQRQSQIPFDPRDRDMMRSRDLGAR